MSAILNSLNGHNFLIFQPILMTLVSKFMVYRALSDKTHLFLGLRSPLSKNYTKITALEWSVASHRGLKDILHCAQTFALDLGIILSTRSIYCSVRIMVH